MPHVCLLGDSVFDNSAYVPGNPDVAQQLSDELGESSSVTLLAVDGSITREVAEQIGGVPRACTHMVLSSGGNDVLNLIQVLDQPTPTVGHGLGLLSSYVDSFREEYRALLRGFCQNSDHRSPTGREAPSPSCV
jgi:hypothetical protein